MHSKRNCKNRGKASRIAFYEKRLNWGIRFNQFSIKPSRNSIISPNNDRDEIRGEFLPIPVILFCLEPNHIKTNQKAIKRCQHLRRNCERF